MIRVQDVEKKYFGPSANNENTAFSTTATPVFERALRGFSAERLLKIIVGKEVPKRLVSTNIPTGVRQHASYVIYIEYLACSDILSFGDDNGSWGGHTKPRRKYIVELSEQIGVLSVQKFNPPQKKNPK